VPQSGESICCKPPQKQKTEETTTGQSVSPVNRQHIADMQNTLMKEREKQYKQIKEK
jgi:hypothetical protein